MKISPELRQKIINFTINHLEQTVNPDVVAQEIIDGLTYKKRGRKTGWRKKRVDVAS